MRSPSKLLLVSALAVGPAALATGCEKKPGPPAPASASAPASSQGAPSSASASSSRVAPAASGSSVFGPWTRCYTGFRPEGDPRKDVTRLSMMCGPATGMRAVGDVQEGTPGTSHGPAKHTFDALKGQCVRVFAVSSEDVPDLDLALSSPTGEILARDGIDDRWPILWPDRAVCLPVDGKYTVDVTTKAPQAKGRYAIWTWLLP